MDRHCELPAAQGGGRAERRRYRRFSVLWHGEVVDGTATRCVVLDISAQGTRLRLPAGATLPHRFVVAMPGRGRFDAELVDLAGPIARMRLLDDRRAVADAVADVVPAARFLEEHHANAEALH